MNNNAHLLPVLLAAILTAAAIITLCNNRVRNRAMAYVRQSNIPPRYDGDAPPAYEETPLLLPPLPGSNPSLSDGNNYSVDNSRNI